MNVLSNHQNIFIIDKPIKRNFENFSFILCPYVFPGRFIEAIETIDKDWKNCNFIFSHQEFKGCKMGAIVSIDGDEWKDEYPQIISGHIHDNQKVGKNIYYPGAPLQHAFGDSNTRVVCVIENNEMRDIPLDVPKKKIIKTTISDLNLSILNPSNLKLKLKASSEEFKLFKQTKEYKECIEKGIKIQLDKKENKINKEIKSGSFRSILNDLIISDGDSLLKKIYNEIKLF